MLMIFDRKQDFYDLARDYGLLYLLLRDYQDNWGAPPDGVDDTAWFNILAEILAVHLEYRMQGQALITEVLYKISVTLKKKGLGYPTLQDIANALGPSGQRKCFETNARISHRLNTIANIVGPAASSRIQPKWKRIITYDWALSLAGLAVPIQNLVISVNIAKILLYRIYNNLHSDRLETLIVLDESSTIFPKSGTKKTALLLDYFQQARAFGIGFILATQSMNLADEIFANTAIKIAVGGFGHGSDYEEFGSAIGLNRAQRDFMRTISQPGSAVVKDIRYPYPFTVQIERPEK